MQRRAAVFRRGVAVRWRYAGSWLHRTARRRWLRAVAYTLAALVFLVGAAFGGLSWRLSRGPISLDLFTPLLTAAIQQNFGGQRVDVGGTMIERDKNGHTSLRLVDVVVHDGDGGVVASASKVEVGLSRSSLLIGRLRAESVRLVGAEVSVRIGRSGRVAVFAGGNSRPIAVAASEAKTEPAVQTAPATQTAPPIPTSRPPDLAAPSLLQNGTEGFAALVAWIDGLGKTGLDGYELAELGLVDGALVVDDEREGTHWTFENIDVSLKRPRRGGVEFVMRSDQPGRQWSIQATVAPTRTDHRAIQIEATRVPAKDLLLALRFADLPFSADLPLSVRLRGEIGPSGFPEMLQGAIVAGAGVVSTDPTKEPIEVERAAINFDWNAARRVLLIPMQIAAGGNRYTLLGQVDVPPDRDAPWQLQLGGGSVMLAPAVKGQRPVVLDRVLAQGQIDFVHRRIDLLRAELGNNETGVALSGGYDFSGRPRVMLGLAARPMPLAVMEAIWPPGVAPAVRNWVVDRVSAGRVERVDIAVNAPLDTLSPKGPPIPDEGLSITVVSTGTTLRPVPTLPEIRDADLNVRVTGRTAAVRVGHGTVVLPSGHKLSMADGLLKVPDTFIKPSPSQTTFSVEGTVPAAAELLASDSLREHSGGVLDAATSRGTISGQVALGMRLSKQMANEKTKYAIDVDFNNFAAERMIVGQRLEAAVLHLHADNAGYLIKGDVKIGGSPASMEYRKRNGDAEAEVRLQAVLDDTARGRFGVNLGPALNGPVPIKLSGHVSTVGRDGRFAVEADLTPATVDDLLPGWVKPAAKPARATFTLTTKPTSTRLDDLTLDGSGTVVRGNLELDASGNLVSANFPVFSPSSGDKLSLKANRDNDGALHVAVRGDVYDGRQFVKSAMAGPDPGQKSGNAKSTDNAKSIDLDLDVKVGAIAGYHGEALRSTELKLSRRNGQIRKFTLSAKIGRNATLSGELGSRTSGRQAIYLQTDDAGALFRFTDTYARMAGGHLSLVMDAPTSEQTTQNGTLVIENFAVRGEAALSRVVAGIASTQQSNVEFSALNVDFDRMPGRLTIHDGVVRGPVIGATIDGSIDYRTDDVRMRGTFVPLFGLNNMFGRLPIVGMLLGGSNEGLVGLTYEVVGKLSAPVLRVNPVSAVAPGFIRKFFEFPSGGSGPNRGSTQSTR